MKVEQIAAVCHDANRALCQAAGDHSQLDWAFAAEWQKQSAIRGVRFALANPDAPASAQHEAWMRDKLADGWTYGPEKKPDLKQHPCLVPYAQLPTIQQAKDHLFKAIVTALAPFVSGDANTHTSEEK